LVSDALPAGFEALNTRLATVAADTSKQLTWWHEYRELHDDRVDFASEYVWNGALEYTYSIPRDRDRQVRAATGHRAADYDPRPTRDALDILEVTGEVDAVAGWPRELADRDRAIE